MIVDSSPLLALAMQADRDPVGAGELLTYTVTFGNPSTTALSNVTLSAQLPVGAALQNVSDQGTASGGGVTWVLGSVAAGQSGQRRFTVQVPVAAADGDILESGAEIRDAVSGASARATSATTVRIDAPIGLSLSASPDSVQRGGVLSYQLTLTNRAADPLTGVTLRSLLPGGSRSSFSGDVSLSDGGTCAGGCEPGHVVTWALGSLAVGASRTVAMTMIVSTSVPRFADGTLITTRAWVLADGGGSAVDAQSVAVSSSPLLALAMQADRDPVGAGELLTYTVTFGNPSTTALNNVTLTAQLPVGAALQNVSDQGTASGGGVTWVLGSVPAGQSGQRRFTVQVGVAAAGGDILESGAEIRDAVSGASARATSATTVRSDAAIGLSLSASPDSVQRGGVLSYQLTVTNRAADPLTGVTLRSVLPDGSRSSFSGDVSLSDGGTCGGGCDPGHIVTWALGSLAGGASRTVAMTMIVSTSTPRYADGTLITTRAWVFAEGGASAVDAQSVAVSSSPLLALAMHGDRDPVGAGELLTYTLTFGNPSTTALNNVTLTAQLPVGAALQNASGQGTASGSSVTWALGSVPAGQSGQRRLTVQVPATAADGDILESGAEIRDAVTGASARATSATSVRTDATIGLLLSASPDSVQRGGVLSYQLTVTNRSMQPLTGVTLRSVLPDGSRSSFSGDVSLSDSGTCAGGCDPGHVVTWALGSLATGASRTVAITMIVSTSVPRFADGGLITTRAWVLADGGASAVDTQSVAVSSSPLLALAMHGDRDPVGAGELLTYTLTFGNPSTTAMNNVTLTAQLPVGAALQNASDQGTASGSSVTWALGSVPAGQSGQRRFTVQVPATAADGDILESGAEIRDAVTGASARATSATSVRTDATIGLSLSASPDSVQRGGVLSYQLTVTNRAADPLTGVTLRSVLPDGSRSSFSGDVSLSDGGTCAGGCDPGHVATWALGSLAAGASRTVAMTMIVSTSTPRFADGTLITNRAWVLADGGASAVDATSARVCSGGASACDHYAPAATLPLTPGIATAGRFFANGDRAYFVVNLPSSRHLRITLDDLDNLGANEVYVRRAGVPSAGTYDYRFSNVGPDQEITVPDADAGDWYIVVYGASVPVPGDFTIRAALTTGVILRNLAPNRLGNSGPATITVDGGGFDNTAQVVLKSGAAVIANGVASVVSQSRLIADFNLAGVPGGSYELTVTQGTSSASLPFEVVEGGLGHLETQLIVPGRVGRHAPATVIVEYANTGDAAMPAPLLVVRGSDRALMTLDPSLNARGLRTSARPRGFSDTVQILASGSTPGILQPGERQRIAVYYVGLQQPWNFGDSAVQFDLGVFDSSNVNAVDWDALKDELRPDGISSDGWDAVWANFVANVGPTWGDYAAMLADNAVYLGKLGLNITDITELVVFELAQADGLNPVGTLAAATDAYARAPGLSLVFGRVFPQVISRRYHVGVLGRGWSHNWDFGVQKAADGTVVIAGPGGAMREFQPDVRGGFFNQPGDHGKLTDLGGGRYELREADGTKMVFRSDGLLDYVEDLNANRITAAYSAGLLTSLTHSAGQRLQLAYSGGLLQSVTDPYNRVTTYGYDGAQHLVSATYYGTSSISYAYSIGQGAAREHALTGITYPGGRHDDFTYDTRGRLATSSSNGGAEPVSFSYDTAGAVSATDAAANQATFFFEHRGLLAKVMNPLGSAARFSFDKSFNLTSLQGPDGASSVLTFDSRGSVTGTLDPSGNAIAMTYTTNARLDKLTDARGQTTDLNYDSASNLTELTYPNGGQELFTNDAHGEVVAVKNRRGQTITLTRDSAGRVTHKALPEGRTIDYSYDGHGNLTEVIDSVQGTTTLVYDNSDLLTALTYPDGKGFTFAYDAAGRRTERTSHDGYTLEYFYDAVGRLEHLEDGSGRQIIAYQYDVDGRLSREDKGNGTWTIYDYDAASQLLHLVNYAPDGAIISRFGYTYDTNGNRTSMTTLVGTTSYIYDAIGQLTGVTYPDGRHVTYAYDAAGNRTTVNDNGVATSYTTNGLNQYTRVGDTTYGYDPDGNLTSRSDAEGITSYEYDSENRLVGVVTPTNEKRQYTYDALGNRITATRDGDTTHYLQDPIGLVNVVAEYDAGDTLVARYDHGHGLADRVDNAGVPAHYNFDALGNTCQITDQNGGVANLYEYDPFGVLIRGDETVANRFVFGGRFGVVADADDSLFMRVRPYGPVEGRFLSADSIWQGSNNTYEYAYNNPVRFADPSGLVGVEGLLLYRVSSRGVSLGELPSLLLRKVLAPAILFAVERVGFGECVGSSRDCSKRGNDIGLSAAQAAAYRHDVRLNQSGHRFYETDIEQVREFHLELLLDLIDITTGRPQSVGSLLRVPLPLPQPPTEHANSTSSQTATSHDPNQLIGPAGYAIPNYLRGNGSFAYRINFENAASATAPAQVVTISNTIATDLELATLELTSVGFGDYFFAIPAGSQHYEHTERIAYNDTEFDVIIEVKVDYATRQVQVTFESVVPDNGLPPPVDVGFLPPEDGSGRGNGHVAYVIRPVPGLPSGTEIRNIGFITFDPLAGGPTFRTDLVDATNPNSGIDPNRQALVTLDSVAPTTPASPVATSASLSEINLSWSTSSDGSGSGVAEYRVFRAGIQIATTTAAGYQDTMLAANVTYCYRILAVDNAGNISAQSNQTCATTTASLSTPTATKTLAPTPTPTAMPTLSATPTEITTTCAGDCDNSGAVTVDELITGVNIALGILGTDACPQFDTDGSHTVTVNELIEAVNNALSGCPDG